MLRYACGHCLADLGVYAEDETPPQCVDHPDGVVILVEVDDADNLPS